MEGGIDEAGRGPVIGPLVVAGVAVADPQALWDLGCKDSKLLSPANRERLARLIRGVPGARIHVEVIAPEAIDARSAKGLNDLEAEAFIRVAAALDVQTLRVDAADVDAQRFGDRIAAGLSSKVQVIAEHQADRRHATVAAASIIAKTTRDAAMQDLAKRLERRLPMRLGSGYPSDGATVAFLEAWLATYDDLPPGARRSWKTSRRLLDARAATTLAQFGGDDV